MQKRSTLFITLVVLLILADVPGWMMWRAIQHDRTQQDRIAVHQEKEAHLVPDPSSVSDGHGGGRIVDVHQNGAPVNTDKSDQARLCAAIKSGSLKAVQELIAQGANIKEEGPEGTPLICAVRRGNIEIVRYLIRQGADVNATDRYHEDCPLCSAAKTGNVKIARFLVSHGAQDGRCDNSGYGTIMAAVEEGDGSDDAARIETIQIMLAHGADINDCGHRGGNSLLIAAAGGRLEMVRFLLARGIDVNGAIKYEGLGTPETPLHAAQKAGYKEIVALLKRAGGKEKP